MFIRSRSCLVMERRLLRHIWLWHLCVLGRRADTGTSDARAGGGAYTCTSLRMDCVKSWHVWASRRCATSSARASSRLSALNLHMIERCFTGSAAHPGNVTLTSKLPSKFIERCSASERSRKNNSSRQRSNRTKRRKLNDIGTYRFRRDAEYHAYNPLLVRALQKAAQSGSTEQIMPAYTTMVYQRPPTTLRDLLTFVPTTPMPLEQVEPMEAIRARFVASAMSVGALSPETHRTIAAAMNSIGWSQQYRRGWRRPGLVSRDRSKAIRSAARSSRSPRPVLASRPSTLCGPRNWRLRWRRVQNRARVGSCPPARSRPLSPNCAIPPLAWRSSRRRRITTSIASKTWPS